MPITYTLLQSPHPISELGCWESQLTDFTHVIGYSHLGHVFMFDQRQGSYAVFYPFRQAYKSYGPFDSVTTFEAAILMDEGFAEYVLRPGHQAAIAAQIGPLQADEIYIPLPYPHLGGSEEPDTYGKGNFLVFMELVGITHGFE